MFFKVKVTYILKVLKGGTGRPRSAPVNYKGLDQPLILIACMQWVMTRNYYLILHGLIYIIIIIIML